MGISLQQVLDLPFDTYWEAVQHMIHDINAKNPGAIQDVDPEQAKEFSKAWADITGEFEQRMDRIAAGEA